MDNFYYLCLTLKTKRSIRMITKEEVARLPKRSKSFSTKYEICGAAVENGLFSYWYDTGIERDIYDVDAYKLMKALNVETLDELFKVVDEKYNIDTLRALLDENNISYSAYAF